MQGLLGVGVEVVVAHAAVMRARGDVIGDWPTVWDVWCRCAPYLSSFSDPLPLMQLAMMMAEATPRFLFERSIFSVGLVPLSSSIGSG